MSPEVARKLRAVALRRVLMWKDEDGPEDAPDEGGPNDVGPAWLDTYEGDERVSSEKVRDGEWITRAEAQRVAAANGYELAVDD
jgi:hypothetical protein